MLNYKVWECLVCGWVYDEAKGWPDDDIAPGTRWEDIPEDWLCPECGVSKSDFEMVETGMAVASETQTTTANDTPSSTPSAAALQQWECLVCGWIYDEAKGWPDDGIAPGTRWADVPDDWLCPDCGVGKADFEMIAIGSSTDADTTQPAQSPSTEVSSVNYDQPPLVIIGSGLAGYNLVKEVRKLNGTMPIVLITADDGRFYSKPLISTGFHRNKTAEAMATATALEMAEEFNIEVRTLCSVSAIDSDAQTLKIDQQKLSYGKLVLALGASCIEAPLSGTGLSHVYSVNDLMDYTRFRTGMAGAKRVLIIGAGLIGCEYANDLIQSGYQVDVVDPMPFVLVSLLPPTASQSVQRALSNAGVKFHFNTVVKTVDLNSHGQGIVANLSNGGSINADIVLSAIGVRPRTELAEAAGLNVNRGIVVDRFLQTNVKDIYALGDCAEVDSHVLFYVAPLMASARALAKTLCGINTEVYYGTLPVMVKTTLYPVVSNPPARNTKGEWIVEKNTEQGVKAVFKDDKGGVAGFALTGEWVKEKDALVHITHPVMKARTLH